MPPCPPPSCAAHALATEALGFSGYAVSAGNLALPVTDQLSSVADLFSDRTTMRVWWRGPADNRVDVVTPAGETGTHTGAGAHLDLAVRERRRRPGTPRTRWSCPPRRTCCPPRSGRRLLSEAADGELSRIGARRVAGRDALGVRLTPSDAAASVSRADIWVDADTGLPLQVRGVREGRRANAPWTPGSSTSISPSRARGHRLHPAARRRRSARVARRRSCSRRAGGSGRSPCRTSWRAAAAPAGRRPAGHRALRQRGHPARRGAGALRLAGGLRQRAGRQPGRGRRRARHPGGGRPGRADGRASRPTAGRTC